jgi:hypothetical protein
MEFFIDQITEQKSAPKNLFDKWNHEHQADETEEDRHPVSRPGEQIRVEPVWTRRGTEELLGRNPANENEQADRDGEGDLLRRAKLILAPKPN